MMKKVKTSGILVIIGVIFSVMLVWAGYASEYFGAGESRAEAQLIADDATIKGYTIPQEKNWNNGYVWTRCLYYSPKDGSPQKTSWNTDCVLAGKQYYCFTDAQQFVYAGESAHGLDGFTRYLYCNYN